MLKFPSYLTSYSLNILKLGVGYLVHF